MRARARGRLTRSGNFEKHFQEARHAFGMRALGLQNTVQFRDITRIEDAYARTYAATRVC